MKPALKRTVMIGLLAVLLAGLIAGCNRGRRDETPEPVSAEGDLPANALQIAAERGLTPDDINAALKTFMPSGQWDEYLMFASGGHSGNMMVIGIPSMRILKHIAVFTPEAWQGYGFGARDIEEMLDAGNVNGVKIRMGDTHHPALSETEGDYDGQYVFINDKASARVAVIDLRDFETKQIVKDPNIISNHGSTFVTPNTEYVVQGAQYATPLGWEYAPIEEYEEKYRGLITLWKFNRETGRIVPEESFSIEAPPYWQDLCDAGKLVSDGWAFCNSFNTEMATGGIEDGNPPIEAGASQRDMDYLHIFNWQRAEAAVKAGKAEMINGMAVLRMPVAVEEGVLYLAPEPKSPHGADVTPDGKYIVVSGKLDPHVTIYAFDKIEQAIADGNWELDPFGVPILNYDAVKHAQIELGLGPLHSIFDDQGFGYTSLFLDSAVAKWKVGDEDPESWQMVEKLPVQYNIGHLTAAEGDTVSPDGKYVVVLNKWSVDRFAPVGPLLPQNIQLVDISDGNFKVIYDMAMGIGEPHNAQIIKTDKINAWTAYPEVGWDPIKQEKSEYATLPGEERIERNGNTVEIFMTSVRSHFTPERVRVKKGDHVIWHITNIETAHDATHGFQLGGHNISLSLEPGETVTFELDVNNDGTYAYYCTEFCSALHLEMMGYLLVEP
jgi:nitrous-oxide reductase